MGTTGGTSHSDPVSQACGLGYAPYICCRDAASNESCDRWGYSISARSTVWGHNTGVAEPSSKPFLSNWTGTGTVVGSGDSEHLSLQSGQYMQSPVTAVGSGKRVTLKQNQYAVGDTAALKYRTGATEAACTAAPWSDYSTAFVSSGYVQIRVESTL